MNLPAAPFQRQAHIGALRRGNHCRLPGLSPIDRTLCIEHGVFGGEFSYSRMSWIKPNFLWMMYRSGWGMKEGQEVTLGLRLRRPFFDGILARAVASSFDQSGSTTHEAWKADIESSEVRLQWDPDHDPHGNAVARRAIQLGLRGSVLEAFGKSELLEVIDMSAFVAEQRQHPAQHPGRADICAGRRIDRKAAEAGLSLTFSVVSQADTEPHRAG